MEKARSKRNAEMNKIYKNMLKDIDMWMGEQDAGCLIMLLAKSLRKFMNDGTQSRELRTLEVKLNDFYSAKWDFAKGDLVE